MWGKKTSPGGVHCHVQGEIVLKETCRCSFSALVEALLRFSIGKLDGLQRCFLFSLSEFSMWEFGLSCHRPFATRSCFWESPRDCQEMRLVPRIFSFEGGLLRIFIIFFMSDGRQPPPKIWFIPGAFVGEHNLVYFYWPPSPISYLPRGTNTPNFGWQLPTPCY